MHAQPRWTAAAVLAAALAVAGCDRPAATEGARVENPSPAPSPSASPDRSAFLAAVDAVAAEALQRGPIAGLSIAVFEHGQPVLARGYGFADLEEQVAATADTSYPIASVSKHFTAAAVLRLADQGRLGLDDPLSRFFPAARPRIGAPDCATLSSMRDMRCLSYQSDGLTITKRWNRPGLVRSEYVASSPPYERPINVRSSRLTR